MRNVRCREKSGIVILDPRFSDSDPLPTCEAIRHNVLIIITARTAITITTIAEIITTTTIITIATYND